MKIMQGKARLLQICKEQGIEGKFIPSITQVIKNYGTSNRGDIDEILDAFENDSGSL